MLSSDYNDVFRAAKSSKSRGVYNRIPSNLEWETVILEIENLKAENKKLHQMIASLKPLTIKGAKKRAK